MEKEIREEWRESEYIKVRERERERVGERREGERSFNLLLKSFFFFQVSS